MGKIDFKSIGSSIVLKAKEIYKEHPKKVIITAIVIAAFAFGVIFF